MRVLNSYEKLLRYCYMKTNDRLLAEDIVQEAYLRFWQNHHYKDTGKEMAYLYTIARNLCVDEFRKQMFFAFRFGKGVSIGVGIISGLVSALMLTNLGMFVWKYVPVSWTGRIPYTYLKIALGEAGAIHEMKSVIPIFCVFTVISMVYYLFWASRWEGSKISE